MNTRREFLRGLTATIFLASVPTASVSYILNRQKPASENLDQSLKLVGKDTELQMKRRLTFESLPDKVPFRVLLSDQTYYETEAVLDKSKFTDVNLPIAVSVAVKFAPKINVKVVGASYKRLDKEGWTVRKFQHIYLRPDDTLDITINFESI